MTSPLRSSCIPSVPGDHYLTIRQWQIEACDGNQCAAALLSFFEGWHNTKLVEREQARSWNDVAERHSEPRTQNESLLQWHTEAELRDGILGLYSRTAIRDAIAILEAKQFITKTKNPRPGFHFDRTNYFLFRPELVILWLEEHGKLSRTPTETRKPLSSANLNDQPKMADRGAENGSRSAENGSRSAENGSAINYILLPNESSLSTTPSVSPPSGSIPLPQGGGAPEPEPAKRGKQRRRADVGTFFAPDDFPRDPTEEMREYATIHAPHVDIDIYHQWLLNYEFKDTASDWTKRWRMCIVKEERIWRRDNPGWEQRRAEATRPQNRPCGWGGCGDTIGELNPNFCDKHAV